MPITAVSAEPISGSIKREIAIVSSLGEHAVGNYVLLRVADEAGNVGLGEASVTAVWSGETQAGVVSLVREVLAPLVVGADPFDSEWIGRRLERAAFGNSFARAALEMALIDLQGQSARLPAYKLLGGRDRPHAAPGKAAHVLGGDPGIRLKFVIGAEPAGVAAERARTMAAKGWKAIKVKVGRDVRADAERLRAVRDAIGPACFLSVDANGGYSVADAIRAAREFEKVEIALFEQPTKRGDHAAMAEVRARSPMPVMADESAFTAQDVLDLIRHRAADLISLYPGKHGGMRATLHLARMAEAAGVACTIGSNLEREVATAAMAHVAVASPNIVCERYPGDLIGPLYFEKPLTAVPLRYATDRLYVPEGPGLGVAMP
ncbi:MAG: mandelate racemase/muconate lactonizing protein [Gemmataceae bacterium]|nr:mandelate racemase/muconate lactonizing protein [Gemmataceae bacterium]